MYCGGRGRVTHGAGYGRDPGDCPGGFSGFGGVEGSDLRNGRVGGGGVTCTLLRSIIHFLSSSIHFPRLFIRILIKA